MFRVFIHNIEFFSFPLPGVEAMQVLLRPFPLGRHPYQVGKFLLIRRSQRPSIAIRLERRHVNGSIGPSPSRFGPQEEDTEDTTKTEYNKSPSNWGPTLFKMFESAATTFASLFVLGLVDTESRAHFENVADHRRPD